MFPDVNYAPNLMPGSSSSINNSPSTKAPASIPNDVVCNSLSLFDLDFASKFEEFISPYEQDEPFRTKRIEPIIIDKYPKPITNETDLQEFFDVFSYYFLGRIGIYDEKHKLIYHSNPVGIPHLRFLCHGFASLAELKLDVKFVTSFSEEGEDYSVIDFYNKCNGHKGGGKCNHYVCNAIFQVYGYLANNNIEYGMLSTFERSWLCKIEHDANGKATSVMQITEAYATSYREQNMNTGIERHSLFEVLFVLFSLMHTSKDAFKINNSDEFLKRTNDKDYDDNNDDYDDNNDDETSHSKSPLSDTDLPMPDFSHVNSLKIWPWEQGFLAEGRCGQVFIGAVNGIKAAVKAAEISKMENEKKREIKKEMRNEAKILHYLNTHHYEHAPKLLYCGYWCGSLFFTVATRLIHGHHKHSRKELSETERKNLDTAIEKLHELNVTHNDLKWNNVIFCDDGKVFIIDYGFAGKGPVSISNENRYDLDDDLNG